MFKLLSMLVFALVCNANPSLYTSKDARISLEKSSPSFLAKPQFQSPKPTPSSSTRSQFLNSPTDGESRSTLNVVEAWIEIHRTRLVWTFQGARLPPDLRDDFVDDDIRVDREDTLNDAQMYQHAALALLRVRFNRKIKPQLLFVDFSKTSNSPFDGTTRLVCGSHLFESIPSSHHEQQSESILRHTTKATRFHPEHSSAIDLLHRHVLPESIFTKAPPTDYVAILPLSHLCSSRLSSRSSSPSRFQWEECYLRFLAPSEQLRSDSRVLKDEFGNYFTGDVKLQFRSSTGTHALQSVRESLPSITHEGNSLKSSNTTPSPSNARIYGLLNAHRELMLAQLRLDRSKQRKQHQTAHLSGSKHWDTATREGGHYSRLRNPHSDPRLLNFIETSADLKVGFIQIIGGLMNPLVEPVADLMGSVVAEAVGPAVANLVLPAMVSGIADDVGETLSMPITTAIIHDTVPGLTETMTESVTQSLQHTIPKNVSTEITPVVTTRVTQSLTQPLTDQIVTWVQNFTAPKVAFHLNQHFGILASNAISIILVSALTETFTHNPLEDYFCYYCEKFRFYCAYCKVAPSRLYYTQYYAHFYSTYYTHYFVNYFSEPGFPDWVHFEYPVSHWPKVELQVPRPSGQGSPWQGYPQWGPQLL